MPRLHAIANPLNLRPFGRGEGKAMPAYRLDQAHSID
jgi:hypothetical protein